MLIDFPPEMLKKIWDSIETLDPIQLQRFASVCRLFKHVVEGEWPKALQAWIGPSNSPLRQDETWRDRTMSIVAKMFSRGPEYYIANVLARTYRFNADINLPESILLAQVQEHLPTTTTHILARALWLTGTLWRATAEVKGDIFNSKPNRFKTGLCENYWPLERKGSLPPPLPSFPDRVLSLYVPHVECNPKYNKNAREVRAFWDNILPSRLQQQERLTRMVSYATDAEKVAPWIQHFVLPPAQEKDRVDPSYFEIPLALFPQADAKPSVAYLRSDHGRAKVPYEVPATGTPAEFLEAVNDAASSRTLLVFAHPAADVFDLDFWRNFLDQWDGQSMIGYALCGSHAYSSGYDTTVYGANGLDYVLAVKMDTLRAAMDHMRATGVALVDEATLMGLGVSGREALAFTELQTRIVGQTGVNHSRGTSTSHVPGEALPYYWT